MRRLVLLTTAAVAVAAVTSCAHRGRAPVKACAGAPTPSPGVATAAAAKPFLGLVALPNSAVVLARLDSLSLKHVSRQVFVGEYHNAWSLSPDHSRLALGVSGPSRRGRIGILIVDLHTMKVVRKVETGIAAEAVGWLAPRVLVAALQRGGTVLVDPFTGKILRRWPAFSFPDASARTRDGFVMVFPRRDLAAAAGEGSAAPRLAVVDPRGRLRSVTLERIQLGVRYASGVQYSDDAGLSVDPRRARAYVFAAEAPVGEIDLRTMRVSYHRLEPLMSSRRAEGEPTNAVRARKRRALLLRDGHVLVFGRDLVSTGGANFNTSGTGATLVDTTTWSSCTLDPGAGGAAYVADRLLVYGSGDRSSPGLRAYTLGGRKVFHLFDREQVRDVHVAGARAYVRTQGAHRVVDVRSGNVVADVVPAAELVDVISGRNVVDR